jgi:hypothetical protein
MEERGQLHDLTALPLGKSSPKYPLIRSLGAPHSSSEHFGEEKNLAPAGNWTLAVQPLAYHYTDWASLTPIRWNLWWSDSWFSIQSKSSISRFLSWWNSMRRSKISSFSITPGRILTRGHFSCQHFPCLPLDQLWKASDPWGWSPNFQGQWPTVSCNLLIWDLKTALSLLR